VASGAAVPVVITVDAAGDGCLLGQGRWTNDQHPLDVGHWDNCAFAGPEYGVLPAGTRMQSAAMPTFSTFEDGRDEPRLRREPDVRDARCAVAVDNTVRASGAADARGPDCRGCLRDSACPRDNPGEVGTAARRFRDSLARSSRSRSSAASRREGRTPWSNQGSGSHTGSPWRWP